MVKITYKQGDKVFAKVKGYPPWPAKVVGDDGKKDRKFNVLFYGTQETGRIKQENLAYYRKYKNEYVPKYMKRAGYSEAVEQIEKDLKNDGGDADEVNLEDSGRDIDITLDDASFSAKKSTPRRKIHKTADNDEPASAVRKGSRRKRSNTSETNSDGTEAKKLRRESTSSVASKSSKTEEETVAPKTRNTVKKNSGDVTSDDTLKEKELADNNSDKNDPSETDDAPEIFNKDNGESTVEKSDVEESAETKKPELDEVDVKEEESKPIKLPIDDLQIVTKTMLNHLILYAEHVKKNPALFKEKSVETRNGSIKDIYAFKLPSGKICGIKLYKEWPPKHSNEYESAIYDQEVANAALEAESLLTAEKKTFEELDMEVVPDIEITERDLKAICAAKDSGIDLKKRRFSRQAIESKLVEWDYKIKSSLGLDNAIPEVAIETLKEFKLFEPELDVLMFKKNPHVLDTLRRLRKYVGNTREWTISNNELEHFIKKAADIRLEADDIYERVQSMFAFDVKDDKSIFWDTFMQVVSDFRMKCKELNETQVLELCAEPDSRQAFLDMLLDKVPANAEKK